MTTQTPPATALRRLVDGPGPDTLRPRLLALLAEDSPAAAGAPGATPRARRYGHRLRRLAQALPPADELCRDPHALAALSECAAVTDPPFYMAVLSHYALCLGSIVALSPDPARLGARWDALSAGRSKGVFLVTEIGDGSSHLGVRTTAAFDPRTGGFVLGTPDAGAAKFSGVGATGVRQTAVVCARLRVAGTDRGVFSFVVDLSDEHGPAPGVEISSGLAVADLPLDYALVRFHGVRLAPDQWLSDGASLDAQGRFHDPLGTADARLSRTLGVGQALWATLPSAMAAMARESAVRALRHSAHRRAHGRLAPGAAVLSYRSQQHALLAGLAEAFALTCAGNTAREIWAESLAAPGRCAARERAGAGMTFSPWAAVDRPLAVLKAFAVRAAARVAAQCQHRCGLAGFLEPNRLSGYHGFAHAFDSAGGDSQLILLDAGRALAEEAGRRGGAAAVPREALPDAPHWWPALTRVHEHLLATGLHRALNERSGKGLEGLELWNPLLDAARELGEAYASRLAAESLARTLATVDDPALQAALRPLAALYGVAEARRLAGRLLTTGVLGAATVRALPAAMDELCDRLLPQLPLLEEAMGAPVGALPTPLGADDYAAALTASVNWPTERLS
ncbi:acyl-CoA dehydrogenase [Streptomyces sp. NPDC053427]|uniref:acyl-CoA dehydrogenase family protein n=1 Tax=Streptomyces sp. NPDC053427 TaxID=3365701 RepID=UPI0037CD6A8E